MFLKFFSLNLKQIFGVLSEYFLNFFYIYL